MRFVRSLVFVAWLYLGMAFVAIVCGPWAAVSRKGGIAGMKLWGAISIFGLRWICGVKVRVEGREHIPKGAALVAMKHQSMFDTLFPGQALDDPCIVYKAELAKAPFLGWYLQRSGMVPVARETQASALKAMLRAARAEIAKGRQMFIFPEGTRQWPGAAADYKPGVAALYRDLGLACTPVATNSGVHWPPHGIVRTPGVIVVRFLPAIAPGLSRDDFMRELETRIESESRALLPADYTPHA